MGTGFHFEEGTPFITAYGGDIPVILVMLAAVFAAEVLLALQEKGRLGLVFPALALLYSLTRLAVRIIQVSGYSAVSARGAELALAFAVENITTLLLLAVCGLCRLGRGWHRRRQQNRTRIDDL